MTCFLFLVNAFLVYLLMPNIERKCVKTEGKLETKRQSTTSILSDMWDLCLVRLFLTMGILMTRFVVPILTDRAFGPAKSGYLTSFTAASGTISAAVASIFVPAVLLKHSAVLMEIFVAIGLGVSLLFMGLSWATSPIWIVFLSMLFINCFFTQCSRILLTELTVQRSPVEQRGTVMGTVTSLTAVSRAACDVSIAALLNFGDLAPIYAGAALSFMSSLIMFNVSSQKVKTD